jgi:hypothetical protein
LTALAIIKEAAALGVRVNLNGDSLALKAATKPPADLLAKLKQHKAEIVALLRQEARAPAHRQLSVTMGKPELSVTAELTVTEPLNVKLPPLNLVAEDKPDRAFDPMSYLEMVDGEWQVTAHGRRVGPPREWLMEKAGLIDAQPTISPPEPPPPETVTAATRLAAIMADPILSDPHWYGMPIRPGGLTDDEWAWTLSCEARCRHVRASRIVAGLEPAATRPAHALTRPKGYSDAEWEAAIADAKRLRYSRSVALR